MGNRSPLTSPLYSSLPPNVGAHPPARSCTLRRSGAASCWADSFTQNDDPHTYIVHFEPAGGLADGHRRPFVHDWFLEELETGDIQRARGGVEHLAPQPYKTAALRSGTAGTRRVCLRRPGYRHSQSHRGSRNSPTGTESARARGRGSWSRLLRQTRRPAGHVPCLFEAERLPWSYRYARQCLRHVRRRSRSSTRHATSSRSGESRSPGQRSHSNTTGLPACPAMMASRRKGIVAFIWPHWSAQQSFRWNAGFPGSGCRKCHPTPLHSSNTPHCYPVTRSRQVAFTSPVERLLAFSCRESPPAA